MSAWLILIGLQGILCSFLILYLRGQRDDPSPAWILIILFVLSLADVVAVVAIWMWKKWGLQLYALSTAIGIWHVEAGKYNVLPVDGRGQQRFSDERPQITKDRSSYTFYPGTQEVPMNASAQIINRPHSITADVDFEKGDEGVLLSQGGIDGGYAFHVQDGKLQYIYNYVARKFFHVESVKEIPEGHHQLRYEFEVTGKPDILKGKGTPGIGQLYIDDELVGQVEMDVTMPLALGLACGAAVGADPGSPVTDKCQAPFAYTGKLNTVMIDVSGELIKDTEAEMRMIMARQ